MSYFFAHKNLIVSACIALAILTLGLVANNNKNRSVTTNPQELPSQVAYLATSTTIVDRDSDVDGLPDWEEHLYGSDALKFDSDGDGTPDGEEVKEGRNPAKANTAKASDAPNDSLQILQDPQFATSATDVLGIKKEFFAKFLAQQSNEIRETTYKELLRSFDVKSIIVNNQIVDLNVSSDNSAVGLHEYGNGFGELIKKYTKRSHRNEQEIVTAALRASSTEILRELQLPAADYKNFTADLKALNVPSSMANFHLNIINGYERMGKGLILMQQLFTNPINGAGGYQAYNRGKVDVTDGYAHVVVLFAKENVVFSPDEAGRPFTYRYPTASSTSKK